MEEFYENNNDINIEANNSMEDFSTHHWFSYLTSYSSCNLPSLRVILTDYVKIWNIYKGVNILKNGSIGDKIGIININIEKCHDGMRKHGCCKRTINKNVDY
jgi:hypothetical protein